MIYENDRLSHFLDASDKDSSNWMRYIQFAPQHTELNLQLYQYDGSLYYYAFRNIQVGQELLLWFDDKFPHYLSLLYGVSDISFTVTEVIQG